jgi:hypothetical protein
MRDNCHKKSQTILCHSVAFHESTLDSQNSSITLIDVYTTELSDRHKKKQLKQTVYKQFYIPLDFLTFTNCSFHITKALYIQ